MTGSKALALEAHAQATGQAFLRFDYFGHGVSDGAFTEGTISRWADDTVFMLDKLTEGPQILIGSSMGGWLMLLAALRRPERIAALIGIAAAPDFTEDRMWNRMDAEARTHISTKGIWHRPNSDGDPTPITAALIEDGRRHGLLHGAIPLTCPVHLIAGMQDHDVPWQTSVTLAERLTSSDIRITLIKDGEHRLSRPTDLNIICAALSELIPIAL
jgi:pimeloyl-ACP methyl ester carboxylesterase